MSVFKCDIKYKQVKGDSLQSTLNKLKAHKLIIGNNIPKAKMSDFILARRELNREASELLKKEVNLFEFVNSYNEIKLIPNKEVFNTIDNLSPFKAPTVPKNFKRDIKFFKGNQSLLQQENEERDLRIQQTELPINPELEYVEEYYEETFDPNIEENIITSEGDYIPNYEPPVYQDNVEKELQQAQKDLDKEMITILEKDKQMESKEDKRPVEFQSKIIKSGVQELFESNLELANEAYESLIGKPEQGKIRLWRVGSEENDTGIWFTDKIEDLAFYLKERENPVLYYVDVTKDELTKAKAKGPEIGDNEFQFMYERGNKLSEGRIKQITPQQKQQAQQLYSQYLDTIQNQFISPNDRIVFGHPTIGKSFLKKQGEDKFISLDDDYATEINDKVKEIADKYNVTTYQVKDGGTQSWNNEYNRMMQEMFNVAKQKAISENKTLFTSNTNLLRNNAESFDKVINLTDKEFERRIQERGAKYDTKEWKSQINKAISKLPANKIINTDKYLSDLFLGSKQDIENFSNFVKNQNQNKQLEFDFNSLPSIENTWTNNQEKLISKFPEITYEDFVSLSNEERDNLLFCL